jgi:hypothetical protein
MAEDSTTDSGGRVTKESKKEKQRATQAVEKCPVHKPGRISGENRTADSSS